MKGLIVYYSLSGNTRRLAEQLQKELDWDIAEIQTVRPYPDSYNAVVAQGKREIESGHFPEIEPMDIDLAQYSTILIGTPVWWYTFAPAVGTFLNTYDMAGKTIWPFATNGGGAGHTLKDIKSACPGAKVCHGISPRFSGERMMDEWELVQEWLEEIKK